MSVFVNSNDAELRKVLADAMWELDQYHDVEDADAVLDALTDAGFVVVRADGLQHGDVLVRVERAAWDDGLVMNMASNRQPDGDPVFRRAVGGDQ